MQTVLHLLKCTVFQPCRYGSKRPKRTTLAFNADEFSVINKMCEGVSATHHHDKWGIFGPTQQFATSLETAYPMPLARAIASAFVLALHNRGTRMPPETMSEINDADNAALPALLAQPGLQSQASKLPPLIPDTSQNCRRWSCSRNCPLCCRWQHSMHLQLAKRVETLQNSPSLLPDVCLQGVYVSGQQLQQEKIDKIVAACATQAIRKFGRCETQLWGDPWSEDDFAAQMVKFGHLATLQTGLPSGLKDTIDGYRCMDVQQPMSFRVAKLGFWLKRLVDLRDDEKKLKSRSLESRWAEEHLVVAVHVAGSSISRHEGR